MKGLNRRGQPLGRRNRLHPEVLAAMANGRRMKSSCSFVGGIHGAAFDATQFHRVFAGILQFPATRADNSTALPLNGRNLLSILPLARKEAANLFDFVSRHPNDQDCNRF